MGREAGKGGDGVGTEERIEAVPRLSLPLLPLLVSKRKKRGTVGVDHGYLGLADPFNNRAGLPPGSHQGVTAAVGLEGPHDPGQMPPPDHAHHPPLPADRPAPLQCPRQVEVSLEYQRACKEQTKTNGTDKSRSIGRSSRSSRS